MYDAFAAEALLDGHFDEAHAWNLRARNILVAAYGEGAAPTLVAEVNLCESAQALGRISDALDHCENAVAIARAQHIADPLRIAPLENNYGAVLMLVERFDEAGEHFGRALELWSRGLGADSMFAAIALSNLAEVRLRLGDAQRALELYQRSVQMRERLTSPTDAILVTPTLGISAASLALDDFAIARKTAERALAIARTTKGDRRPEAKANEALALALAAAPGGAAQRARSVELMREALALLDEVGPSGDVDRERIQRWLAAH
ncbi:MAG TPA: tetratricopeptide repeat protein [Nannocystaceae bacterium]|nr:tetratricopeptide repeat protein [Nannocystaceae bacterium]